MSRERRGELAAFQKIGGSEFRVLELLNRALTHRSCANEDPSRNENNERLEFLGDAVLGMVAASYLFTKLVRPSAEGELARIKSFIVSEDTLSELARGLGVDRAHPDRQGRGAVRRQDQEGHPRGRDGSRHRGLLPRPGLRRRRCAFVLQLLTPEVDKVLDEPASEGLQDHRPGIRPEAVPRPTPSTPWSRRVRSGPRPDLLDSLRHQRTGSTALRKARTRRKPSRRRPPWRTSPSWPAGGQDAQLLQELG
ncbi:MAG: hypothetical protein MZU97_07970 [Bacillus subtilis]|nr:hypothetical protein [Bacillus subtilis]